MPSPFPSAGPARNLARGSVCSCAPGSARRLAPGLQRRVAALVVSLWVLVLGLGLGLGVGLGRPPAAAAAPLDLAAAAGADTGLGGSGATDGGTAGAKLFDLHCSGCHPQGGNIIRRGRTLRLDALERRQLASPEAIAVVAAHGIGQMGGYGEALGRGGPELVGAWVWQQAQAGWPRR